MASDRSGAAGATELLENTTASLTAPVSVTAFMTCD